MIYVVKKFRHYLLANKFVFFTDHQVLLYLVNKPCNTCRIVRWFLILLEFDFTVVVKKGITHQRVDHLSRLLHGEALDGIPDDLLDAYLFNVEMIHEWSVRFAPMLTSRTLRLNLDMRENKHLIEQSCEYFMLARRLYKLGKDGILRLCIERNESGIYVEQAHIAIGNIHISPNDTIRRVERMGVYWPTMRKDVYACVRRCSCSKEKVHTSNFCFTLFQVSITTPNWAETIVKYLSTNQFLEKMNKTQQRYLQKEATYYCLIANQLYH